ncbi:type II secretion system F family protein [Nocardia cyriacigeorgica]|uniref:type II secretion system F family protein n=1 Tax=Nocardia cyriacigeorgica TaxID=135487 RepID=UPI00189540DF|nr:type II secretion system F family protein [Nocardia cyriacigeorgica]MBF6099429.1 type II secretion system F family protein [Nocardia cyriacigeorgica]MBF6160246.1 type II secretion system F family protein [Nocardia cyriacigeorgica]MBF6199330.1 type II secretion system F family protein [Nocardia cyriacigeorgica]MBF6315189.1 type II secretion system F family protein [Nocardia cyriacigeorgica]MBF6343255.1 type II secretion system F family protein [Nocardia cyriacigeorgica]
MGSPAAVAAVLSAVALLLLPGRLIVTRRLNPAERSVAGRRRFARAKRPRGVDPLAAASVFDLLAACLRAGMPIDSAVYAVVSGAPPALAGPLRRAADLLALGADAASAWERAAREATDGSGEIEALARLARRSARSGSSLAVAVGELAEQRRGAVQDAAAARAERAGVLIGGPLGLCFLPAFICLGIVPVIIGLAGRVLGGGLL